MTVWLYLSLILSPFTAWGQTTGNNNNTNQPLSAILFITEEATSRVDGLFQGELNATATFIRGGVAGGLVGGCAPGETSSASTCNNCQADLASCNTRRVHDDLELTIGFRPINPTFGINARLAFVRNNIAEGQPGSIRIPVIRQSPSGFLANQTVNEIRVTVRWSDICRELFNGTGCDDSIEEGSFVLTLGVDEDGNTQANEDGVQEVQISMSKLDTTPTTLCQEGDPVAGACNFRAFPGDGKVFIEDLRTGCSFPTFGGTQAQFLRVFYKEADGAAPNAQTQAVDLRIGASQGTCSGSQVFSLQDNTVEGLTNGTTYRFSIGLLDEANNLGGILDLSGASIDPEAAPPADGCYSPDPNYPFNCHVATPDDVFGLIEDEFDCFITTATYGTPFRPKVEDFRMFRNKFLKTNATGRALIQFYYRYSPPIADWIRNHQWSKPIMRVFLYPFWLFAKACLEYPIHTLASLFLTLLGMAFYVGRRRVTA